jgi:tetratricopeptide (TPR) repeat protein
VNTGESIGRPWEHRYQITAMAFDSNGTRAMVGCLDGDVHVWNVDGGVAVGLPLHHGGRVKSVAFSHDGENAITGGVDYTAKVWDLKQRRVIGPPIHHSHRVEWVAFSDDDRFVQTWSADYAIQTWPLSSPWEGDPAAIQMALELMAGTRLDDDGALKVLHSRDWQDLHSELEETALPPALRSHLLRQQGRTLADQGKWEQAIDRFDRALQANPHAWRVRLDRAKACMLLGRWREAAQDYAVQVQHTSKNEQAWAALAALSLLAGEPEGYQATCRAAYRRLTKFHVWAQTRLVITCTLGPECGVDHGELTELAERALGQDQNARMKLAKGMIDYRCGRFEEAIGTLPEAGDECQVPLSHFFRAMAYHRLGDKDEACQHLQHGIEAAERSVPTIEGPPLAAHLPERWIVWCMIEAVRREAEKLIGPVATASTEASP